MEVGGARTAWFTPMPLDPGPVNSEEPGTASRRGPSPAPDGARSTLPRLVWLVAWTLAVVAGEIVTWFLVRSQGNVVGGDSPHYLIAAQALSHLTVDVIPAYARDMITHTVYNWPVGTTVRTPFAIHAFLPGPHGPVFAQGIGLPALLAPFIAVGSVPLALVGLFTIDAVGVVLLHQRASRLSGIGRGGRAVFALALAAPALWLASTQVYPDLISGIFLACGFVELALLERNGHLDRLGTAVLVVSFGTVPWFQIKNAIPALVGTVAFAIIGARRNVNRSRLIVVTGVVLASIILLLVYNEFYFARLLGLPQPSPAITSASLWRAVALLFDRDQGLFVQVPTALLGVVGLLYARRRNPVCVVALVVAVVSILAINGTYPFPPLGGSSFAGRFQWTVVPMLLVWSPEFIARLQAFPRRMVLVGAAIGGLWAVQLVPIVLGDHVYTNEWYELFRPWDPSLYPGWWPLLDRFLPTFAYPSTPVVEMLARLLLIVLVLGACFWLLVRLCRPGSLRPLAVIVVGAAAALVLSGLAVFGPGDALPARPQTWSGTDLGSPWSPGAAPYRYPPIRLLDIGAGTYQAVFTYTLSGSSMSASTVSLVATPSTRPVVSKWLIWRHPTDAAPMIVTPAPLDIRQATTSSVSLGTKVETAGSATFHLSVTAASTLSFEVHIPPHGHLVGNALRLRKLSNQPGQSG